MKAPIVCGTNCSHVIFTRINAADQRWSVQVHGVWRRCPSTRTQECRPCWAFYWIRVCVLIEIQLCSGIKTSTPWVTDRCTSGRMMVVVSTGADGQSLLYAALCANETTTAAVGRWMAVRLCEFISGLVPWIWRPVNVICRSLATAI